MKTLPQLCVVQVWFQDRALRSHCAILHHQCNDRGLQLWDKSCSSMHWWDLVRSGEPVEGSTLASDLHWLTWSLVHPRKCRFSAIIDDPCILLTSAFLDWNTSRFNLERMTLIICDPKSETEGDWMRQSMPTRYSGTQHKHISNVLMWLNRLLANQIQTLQHFTANTFTSMPKGNCMTLRLLLVFPLPASPILAASPENAVLSPLIQFEVATRWCAGKGWHCPELKTWQVQVPRVLEDFTSNHRCIEIDPCC